MSSHRLLASVLRYVLVPIALLLSCVTPALAPAVWGRGFATEGALAALRFAFTTLDRPRVISLVSPQNIRSAGVARRIGEQIVDRIELRGKPADVWALDRTAWRAGR